MATRRAAGGVDGQLDVDDGPAREEAVVADPPEEADARAPCVG